MTGHNTADDAVSFQRKNQQILEISFCAHGQPHSSSSSDNHGIDLCAHGHSHREARGNTGQTMTSMDSSSPEIGV